MSDRGGESEQEQALRDLLPAAVQQAKSVGPNHPLWDVVTDAMRLLDGDKTVMHYRTRREGVERLYDLLKGFEAPSV